MRQTVRKSPLPTNLLPRTPSIAIQALSIPQLEDLAEALLDFSQPSDLTTWLQNHQS